MCDEELFLASEVFVDFPILIKDVDDYHLLLLLRAQWLFETVMDTTLADAASSCIIAIVACHIINVTAQTGLLFLQVLRCQILLLRTYNLLWRHSLLRRLLQA